MVINGEEWQARVAALEARNSRVEAGKAWEVSWTRRLSVAVLTYVVLGSYLAALDVHRPWANAVVPTAGYLLSTLALGRVKALWMRRRLGQRQP